MSARNVAFRRALSKTWLHGRSSYSSGGLGENPSQIQSGSRTRVLFVSWRITLDGSWSVEVTADAGCLDDDGDYAEVRM